MEVVTPASDDCSLKLLEGFKVLVAGLQERNSDWII